jgi:CHAT domain-containing protein/tetratricopeptide (TPR) repeat protein
MAPADHHEFVLDLRAGEVAVVTVRQRGIDVVLTVADPDGRERHRVDRPNVDWGRETITVVADATGRYRLRISPLVAAGPAGRYRLQMTRLGRADAQDQQRIEAERDVTDGEVARAANTLDGCRQAVQLFGRAASLWRELREPYEEGVALYGLALAHRNLGEHEESLHVLERVITLMRRTGDAHGFVMAQSGLGWTHLYLANYDTAASHFRQALLHRSFADHRGTAGNLFGLGWTSLLLDKPQEALATFTRALRLRKLAADRRGEALTLVGLAAALDRLARWKEAAETASRALEIHETFPDRYGQADALTVKAWALLHDGQASQALALFVKATDVRRALEDAAGEAAALHGEAAATRSMGDSRASLDLADRALALVESVRAQRTDRDLRAAYFASVQGLYELCIDLLLDQHRTTGNPDAARRAFQVSERARARSLLDSMPVRGDAPGNAQTVERGSAPAGTDGVSSGIEPLSLEEVQRALDVDTSMLAYATGASRSVVWLIGHDEFSTYQLPPVMDIERAARSLLTKITRSPSTSGVAAMGAHGAGSMATIAVQARALARLVLPDDLVRRARRRIVVVPSGPLQVVPFGILPTSVGTAGNDRILLDDHEVVTLPSASIIRGLRRADWDAQRRKTVAVFADPVLQADDARVGDARKSIVLVSNAPSRSTQQVLPKEVGHLPRLFATRWEAEEIGRLVPPADRMMALDFRASRSTLERLDLSTYQILHFGTHAIVDLRRPERSGLVLSVVDERGHPVDGFIRAREIFGWRLKADLVVLSGCRTGLGREIRGEGLMALSRGFLAAGASRLVMSLWPVDDKATAELMAHFYRHMLSPEHLTPSAALRAAKLEMRRQPRWRAPYFWAGFLLQGDWN